MIHFIGKIYLTHVRLFRVTGSNGKEMVTPPIKNSKTEDGTPKRQVG